MPGWAETLQWGPSAIMATPASLKHPEAPHPQCRKRGLFSSSQRAPEVGAPCWGPLDTFHQAAAGYGLSTRAVALCLGLLFLVAGISPLHGALQPLRGQCMQQWQQQQRQAAAAGAPRPLWLCVLSAAAAGKREGASARTLKASQQRTEAPSCFVFFTRGPRLCPCVRSATQGRPDGTCMAAAGAHLSDDSAAAAAHAARVAAAAAAATEAVAGRGVQHPGVIEADLPGDNLLKRPYPSFKEDETKLPPRGLGRLPQAGGGSELSLLGGPHAGVGALGAGAPLWNILGKDAEEVDAAVEKERQFVESRWMERLAETHRLIDKQHDAVREQQAEKLRRMPQPKWAIAVDSEEVEAPAPLAYDFKTYGPHFNAYIEATRDQVTTSDLALHAASGQLLETPLPGPNGNSSPRERQKEQQELQRAAAAVLASGDVYGPAASGFRLKQITPPVAHRQGISSFFYFHSPHSAPFVPFINACRRTTFTLPRPAVTALRIENLDSFVDAPPHQPPSALASISPHLPEQQQQQQRKGISPSAFLSRLPVEVGMCVIGMREDVEDLVENLRQIVFRRRPKAKARKTDGGPPLGTFENPWVASLSVKGPIAAVAGDLVLPDELEVINKSQYLCTMNANYYLNFKVKIEEIEEYVLPEFGYDSLNRDIDAEGFFYFASYCTPVPAFGFEAQRVPEATKSAARDAEHHTALKHYNKTSFHDLQRQRYGRDPSTDPVLSDYSQCLPSDTPAAMPEKTAGSPSPRSSSRAPLSGKTGQTELSAPPATQTAPRFPYESLGEIVTIEIHTDGSATPRQAFLEALGRVQGLASSVEHALLKNCKESRDGSVEEEFEDPDMYQDKHRYIGVPWNPYKDSLARTIDRHKTFFRKDMLRQYSPVKEQLMARRELFGVQSSLAQAHALAEVSGQQQQQQADTAGAGDESQPQNGVSDPEDAGERLLDEEELEDELVQRSPTIRLEREKEYQATLKLRQDIETGKQLQERGDGEGMPKFPIKHADLEMPPDWVFEDFMAQRVPLGMVTGFTND